MNNNTNNTVQNQNTQEIQDEKLDDEALKGILSKQIQLLAERAGCCRDEYLAEITTSMLKIYSALVKPSRWP